MASGADTQTHTHTHAYIRTEVMLRNQAGRRAPGLKNTEMYLRKVITLQANNCHNLDTLHMIYKSFQIHNL